MDIYYIKTSAREGYTYEKPTLKFCIDNNELLQYSDSVIRSDSISSNIFVVFYTADSRGEWGKYDVHYFLDKSEADTYFKSVEFVKRSKMVKGYELQTYPIYDKIIDIPSRPTRIDVRPEALLWQKKQYEDGDLSIDERLSRLMEARSAL